MKYRKFGKIGWDVSVLGLGMGQLTFTNSRQGKREEGRSIAMIRAAIDGGINYLDLGYPYNEEEHKARAGVARQAIEEGYRRRIAIAVTLPDLFIGMPGDIDRWLDKQLEWLGGSRVDFCILGRLNRDNWLRLVKLGVLDWADRVLSDGRVGHLGFSFHDHYRFLKAIAEGYDSWTFCQIGYNYLDINHNPGTSGISYAADRGLAVVATNALHGGKLAQAPPDPVARLWTGSRKKRSPAAWALQFVWNLSAVSTVVCNMASTDELIENLAIAAEAVEDSLTVEDEVLISKVREEYRRTRPIPCPSCRPCMPCPQGIDVPRLFEIYNGAVIHDDLEMARTICRDEHLYPDDCNECRLCESRCAKLLPIVDLLKIVKEHLKAGL